LGTIHLNAVEAHDKTEDQNDLHDRQGDKNGLKNQKILVNEPQNIVEKVEDNHEGLLS
jgi:hypothetical protein